jgi:hypothetical protein
MVPPALVIAAVPTLAAVPGRPAGGALLGGPPGAGALEGRALDTPPGLPVDIPPCDAPGVPRGTGAGLGRGDPTQRLEPRPPARYRVASRLGPDAALVGWDVAVSAGASELRLSLPPESAVRGPVAGRIAVAADDGSRSQIAVLDAAAGCGRIVKESEDVVRTAILAPDAESVVYHAVGRANRLDRGIWRIDADGERTANLLPALSSRDSVLDEIGPVWATGLRVSHDGRSLAVESCGAEACRVRVARLAPAEAPGGRWYRGAVVGLTSDRLVSIDACDGLACTLVSTDIASGSDRVLATLVSSASSVVVDGRLFAIAVLQAGGRTALAAFDVGSGARWLAGDRLSAELGGPGTPGDVRLLPLGGDAEGGFEADAGWTVAAVGSPGRLVAIDVRSLLAGAAGELGR